MLISCKEITSIWGIKPKGVLHIGAHEAEESNEYSKLNWGPVIWIEAQSDLAQKLKSSMNPKENKIIHAAAWDTDGIEVELKITNNSQSTSLLDLGTHTEDYPEVIVTSIERIKTSRVDSLLNEVDRFDFINLDIQGAELRALKGMGNFLDRTNYIYTEVNKKPVYIDCAQIDEIERYLGSNGFEKICVRWIPTKGWGDAIFVRKEKIDFNFISIIKSSYYDFCFYFKYFYHEFAHKAKVFLQKILVKCCLGQSQ